MRRMMVGAALLAGGVLLAGCQQETGDEPAGGTAATQATATQATEPAGGLMQLMSLCPGGANCPDDQTIGMLISPQAVRALNLDAPAGDAAAATGAGTGSGTDVEPLQKKPTVCPQEGVLKCGARSGLTWRAPKGQINCRPDKECMPGVPVGVYGWLCTPDASDPTKCEGMPGSNQTAAAAAPAQQQ